MSDASVSRRDNLQRMLIVMPNWVGDAVLATPLLRALRDRFPSAQMTLLAKPHIGDLLAGGDWMDACIHMPDGGLSRPGQPAGTLALARVIRREQFDCAILLPNSFRSALIVWLARVPRRIGYNRDGRGWMLTDRLEPLRNGRKFTPAPMIPYYNEIGRRLGCESFCKIPELFTTPDEEAAVDKLLEEMNVVPGQPIVALNPGGSFGPAKCWPPERFARVADTLAGELGGAVYINYGPSENEVRIAREVAGHMKMPTLVRDKPLLPIGGSKAMIKRSTILITNDTGPRHYANAFGVPVVTVFGPTDPMWTLTETDRERSLIIPVECGPCQQPVCPEGHHKCMQLLDVDMVLTAARELLMDFARGN